MKLPKKPSWRFWRRLTQILCLFAFLWLFRRTEYDGFREIPESANLLFRVDPLVGASVMLGAKEIVLSLLIPGAVLIALTFVLGRFFCGWVCPLGTLLDGAHRGFGGRARSRPDRDDQPRAAPRTPRGWRKVRFAILAVVLVGAVLGLPLVGFFDPFSLLVRGLTFAVDPVLTEVVSAPFDWLYRNASEGVTNVSEPVYGFLKRSLLAARTPTYLMAGLSVALLGVIFLLELAGHRLWCRSLCPLGALLSIPARWSLLRRRPFKACKGCRRCAEECRMEAFDDESRMAPEACILCMDCLTDCPHGLVSFRFESPRLQAAPFDASRRLFLGAAGAGVALAAVGHLDGKAAAAALPHPLRPPGASDEQAFLDRCVRCGLCMKACPTGALQPAGLDGDWQSLFSPTIRPRLGYCEYNCTLCGEICPTGAIPRITEEEKHECVIGKAEFDTNRCLPYARGEPCIVCEEHCPVPDKAIQTRAVEVINAAGEKVTLQQPFVRVDLCVGCGICENKCPLQGAAGIRVRHSKDAAITEEMLYF